MAVGIGAPDRCERGPCRARWWVSAHFRERPGPVILEDQFISGNDHHVVASQRMGATIDGDTKLFDVFSVMRFEGGRQIERRFHVSDQEAFDAFFSSFA